MTMLPGLQSVVAGARACVLDAARIKNLLPTLASLGAKPRSLYNGPTADDLADVAPYLVQVEPDSQLARWFAERAWGKGGAILLNSEADPEDLRAHLRHFLMVLDEAGKALYFRFYDPRVLRIFLPTCDAEQLKSLFGPITAFVAEDEDPAHALQFTLVGGTLDTERLDLSLEHPVGRLRIEWKGRR